MRRRRGAVLQGREGRKHVLHRQRPLSAGGIRHRTAGRRHRRRVRHAVALEPADPDAGMHRGWRGAERELHPGRGALRAKPGVRLLLPAPLQRAAVPEYRKAGATAGRAVCAAGRTVRSCIRLRGMLQVTGVWSSARYLLADFIGDDDAAPPFLPDGLPDAVVPVVSEAIERLIDYQGPGYAQLYVDRLRRFIGRRGVDEKLLCEIARLMAARMSYDDPVRIAQTTLAGLDAGAATAKPRGREDIRKFRWDELVEALPAAVADPLL